MIKYLAIPLILVGCTAPVTDPPAHACSPRLDGKPTYCPDERDLILLPREEAKGEIDMVVWSIVWMIVILLISVSVVIYYIMRYDHFFPNE